MNGNPKPKFSQYRVVLGRAQNKTRIVKRALMIEFKHVRCQPDIQLDSALTRYFSDEKIDSTDIDLVLETILTRFPKDKNILSKYGLHDVTVQELEGSTALLLYGINSD